MIKEHRIQFILGINLAFHLKPTGFYWIPKNDRLPENNEWCFKSIGKIEVIFFFVAKAWKD